MKHYYALIIILLCSFYATAQQTTIMPSSGTRQLEMDPCQELTVLDPGGTGNYTNRCTSILVLTAPEGATITLQGNYRTESGYDKITIYNHYNTVTSNQIGTYSGNGTINVESSTGYLTIKFTTDGSVVNSGYELTAFAYHDSYSVINNIIATNVTDSSLSLAWNDNRGAASWTVRYGTNADYLSQSVIVYAPTVTLPDLEAGTKYYYQICNNEIDPNGEGTICESPRGEVLTHCPAIMTSCINFTDLTGCRTTCYYGDFDNPRQNEGVIDYGSTSQYSRHTVINTRTYNPRATRRGDTLWTIPEGEIASVRLGNWMTGAEAECISYQYTVDTNVADLLILKYAAVLENPNHTASNQPLFMFDFTDSLGNTIDPMCYSAVFVPGYTQSDWHGTSGLKWKDWTTIGVDLTPLHGMTFNINLTTKDCLQRGHYGYSYFTLGCSRKAFYTTTCGYSVDNDITAPDGFNYRWYKADEPTVTLSREQTLHISEYGTFGCDLSFAGGASGSSQCGFSMSMTAGPRFAHAVFTPETVDTVRCRSRVTFHNASVVTEDPEHNLLTLDECNAYEWIIDDSIVFTDQEPTYDFSGGHHQVTLIAYIGSGDCGDTLRHTYEFEYLPGSSVGYDAVTVVENELPYFTYLDAHFVTDVEDTIFMLENAIGCDSAHHLRLNVCRNVDTTVYGAVCENAFPISWMGSDFSAPGRQQLHLYNHCGADSNVTLVLGTYPTYLLDYIDTTCDNQTYYRSGHSFSQAGVHTIPLQSSHGCDSVERIDLRQMPTYIDTDHISICRFDSVIWHDGLAHYDIVAPLPQTILPTRYGCDSLLRLALEVREVTYATDRDTVTENNLPSYTYNGAHFATDVTDTLFVLTNSVMCDSMLSFSLYVCRNQDTVLERVECDNTFPYQWYDGTFASPDTQTFTYPNRCGADSVVTLRFSAYPSYIIEYTDTICDNQTFSQSGQTFNDEGMHTIMLHSIHNCDSVENIMLHVMDTYIDTDYISICRFDSVTWHDSLWHYDIVFPLPQAMLHSRYGCDSLMRLALEVREVTYATDRDTVTENNLPSYTYNGAHFATDVDDTLFVLTNSVMCDSMLTFSLYVCRNQDTVLERVECDNTFPYQWYDGTFTGPDTQTFTYPNRCAADSVVTLRFSAYPSYLMGYTDTICDNQTFTQSGQTFSIQGTHEIMLRTMHDCDSLESILLNVMSTYDVMERNVICRNDVLHWMDGNDYSQPPLTPARHMLHSQYGCDSLITLQLIVNEHSYTTIFDTVTENNLPSYTFNGVHFVTDVHDTVFHFVNAVNCDSLLTYSLYVCRNQTVELQRAECDNKFPLQWDDGYFTDADTQHFSYLTFCGADSVLTLKMAKYPTYFTLYHDTICDNYIFWRSGNRYIATGIYDIMHTSHDGCDSLEREDLMVMPTYNDTDHVVLCWQDSMTWVDGFTYVAEPAAMPTTMMFTTFGCDSLLTLNLTINPPVRAAVKALPEKATIDDPYITLIDGSLNSVRRHWYVLGALVDSTSPATFRYPIEEPKVTILMLAYDDNGCMDSATAVVTIDHADIMVPNIFTPTKIDNNTVKIIGINIDQFEAYIYDRRGILIYTFKSLDDVWDGTYKGKLCQQDSYVYKIRYTTRQHPKSWLHKVGTITLVR